MGDDDWMDPFVERFLDEGRASVDDFVQRLEQQGRIDRPSAGELRRRLGWVRRYQNELLQPPGRLPTPGRHLGTYRLLEEIGRGGMGVVYRARSADGREVAIKVPQLGRRPTAQDRERVRREADSARALQHPAVVPVLDLGELDGQPYLVLELVRGVSLAELLRRWGDRRPPTGEDLGRPEQSYEDAVVGVALRVLEALAEAHQLGILHRDIKPENVMIDGSGRARILDFGVAHLPGEDTLTRTGERLGTPAYLAPEARADAKRAGPRSDVFAVGVLLYEMLATRPALRPSRLALGGFVDAPPARTRGVEPRLSSILARAMSVRPKARYADAGEMLGDLLRYARGQAVEAREPPRLVALGRTFGRGLVALVTAGALGLGMAEFVAEANAAITENRRVEAAALVRDASLMEYGDAGQHGADDTAWRMRACEQLADATELDPGCMEARLLHAVLLYEIDELEQARQVLDAIPSSLSAGLESPLWIRAALERHRTEFVLAPDDAADRVTAQTDLYLLARSAQRRGASPEEVVPIARRAQQGGVLDAAAYFVEGVVSWSRRERRSAEALAAFRAAYGLAGPHPQIALYVADVRVTLADLASGEIERRAHLTEATRILDESVAAYPTQTHKHYAQLASTYLYKLDDAAEAERVLRAGIHGLEDHDGLSVDLADVLLVRAQTHPESGALEEMGGILDGLRHRVESPQVSYLVACHAFLSGQLDEAEAEARAVLDHPGAGRWRGRARELLDLLSTSSE